MSDNRKDISEINQYLQGKLDNKAMHQMERDAQDDPFLMDALAGYETVAKDQQENLVDLDNRLAKRIAQKTERSIILWRVLPIAATVLLMIGAGYWLVKNQPAKVQYANTITVDSPKKSYGIIPHTVNPVTTAQIKEKHAAFIVKKQAPVEDLLKKVGAPGADSNGYIAKNNQVPNKALNISGDTTTLSGPIVRGYVKRNHDLITGGSYITTGKEVQDNPVANVEQLLQGKVAGLNIQNNTGAPGMRGSANIRGLVLVDSAHNLTIKKTATNYIITGKVTESATGIPLEGVTIGAQGKGLTQTDVNGNFKVIVPLGTTTLVVTNIGFTQQVVKLDSPTNLAIRLTPQANSLAEVFIRGYVKRNRDETTGSSYIITGKEAKKTDNGSNWVSGGKVPGKFLPINPAAVSKIKNCNENLKFKDKFFADVAIAEKYTSERKEGSVHTVSARQFLNALRFIAKYAPVSFGKIESYQIAYPDFELLQADKNVWLKWYEANKCNGLK